jgi:hypothetical protein
VTARKSVWTEYENGSGDGSLLGGDLLVSVGTDGTAWIETTQPALSIEFLPGPLAMSVADRLEVIAATFKSAASHARRIEIRRERGQQ